MTWAGLFVLAGTLAGGLLLGVALMAVLHATGEPGCHACGRACPWCER